MVGFKIDADHGTQFQINKQQKNVVNGGELFDGQNVDDRMASGPDHHTANNKQRNIMKAFYSKITKTVEERFKFFNFRT